MIERGKLKAKRGRAEDFIGKTFNNGNLEVVEMIKEKGKRTKYKSICKICSPDLELFPKGYFISYKYDLERGSLPCGCSDKPEWEDWQWLIRVKRLASVNKFVVHGFAEEFHGYSTKINCECLIDNHKWKPTLDNVIAGKSSCPKCSGVVSPTQEEALNICDNICKQEGYTFIGLVGEYTNTIKTKIKYLCDTHGEQTVTYNKFVNSGNRCRGCAKYGYSPDKPGSFYVVKWTKDNYSFIKFGITNQKVLARIKQQARKTKYSYDIIFQVGWKDGKIADNLEKYIKRSCLFKFKVINKIEFEDGFTETVNEKDLPKLKDYINSFVENIESNLEETSCIKLL